MIPNKLRYLLLFYTFIVCVVPINAQKDTIFYDAQWKVINSKDSASFYRPPIKKVGDLFHIQDYHISGQVQMDGYSISDVKDIWTGKVSWYYKDGSLQQEANYSDGYLEGEFISFLNGEKLTALYKKNRWVSGKRNIIYASGRKYYMEKKGDTIKEIIYQDSIDGIRLERVGTDEIYEIYAAYYGKGGAYIGKKNKLQNGKIDGVDVIYNYDPMRVVSVSYYDQGTYLGKTAYYPNGRLQAQFKKEPELATIYYNRNGEQIGEITYTLDQYGSKPYNGKEYSFGYYGAKGADAYCIKSSRTYANGNISEDETYYDECGVLKTVNKYKDGKKYLQISYLENGDELSRMEYDNYRPMNGTQIVRDTKSTYKDGKLIVETNYFPNSKVVKSTKTPLKEVYFDFNGEKLGELSLNGDETYPKPVDGLRFSYHYKKNTVERIESYKDGVIVKATNWREQTIGNNKIETFKEVNEYSPNGYDKVRTVKFYSNGEKQSDITYKGYKEQNGLFYDQEGKLIGEYDFLTKNGKRYDFFSNSYEIKEFEESKNGKQLKFKRYDYGPYTTSGAINPVLMEDIDVACCAMFYKREDGLIAKTEFKNGIPWVGEYFDTKTREKFTIENGVKSGLYQKLDYNFQVLEEGNYVADKKEGTFKKFTYAGAIISEENYKAGVLHGVSTYFDEKGEVVGKMEYKDGNPYEGTRTIDTSYKKEKRTQVYKAGRLTKETAISDNGRLVKTFKDDDTVLCELFYLDTAKKKLVYNISGGVINGKVIRYDQEGNIQATANIERSTYKSGVLFLKPQYSDNGAAYYKVRKNEKEIEITIFNERDEKIFSSIEQLQFNNAIFSQKLEVNTNQVYEYNLY